MEIDHSPEAVRLMLSRSVPTSYCTLIEQMKFYIEPEISCSRFFGMACFTEESLKRYRATLNTSDLRTTELGAYVQEHMRNGLLIDIPCGLHALRDPLLDYDIPPLAAALGATDCWEVDMDSGVVDDRMPLTINVIDDGLYQRAKDIGVIGVRVEHDMHIATMQDDLLGFMSKINRSAGAQQITFYISAIQPDADFCADTDMQKTIAVPYIRAVYDELERVCRAGDIIILNSSTILVAGIDEKVFPNIHPSLALPAKGFTLMRRCAYDKVHVFVRET